MEASLTQVVITSWSRRPITRLAWSTDTPASWTSMRSWLLPAAWTIGSLTPSAVTRFWMRSIGRCVAGARARVGGGGAAGAGGDLPIRGRQRRASGQVEALVDEELPAAEVGRQASDVPGRRIVVDEPVNVARAVHEEREQQQADDDDSDGPAQYELQGSRSLTRSRPMVERRRAQRVSDMAANNLTTRVSDVPAGFPWGCSVGLRCLASVGRLGGLVTAMGGCRLPCPQPGWPPGPLSGGQGCPPSSALRDLDPLRVAPRPAQPQLGGVRLRTGPRPA